MRRLLASCSAAFALASCSSATSSDSTPQKPTWENPPSSVDLYEGRFTDVPIAVRAADPSAVRIEPAAEGALEVEILPDAPRDGLFQAKLRVRAGYGLADAKLQVDVVAGAERSSVAISLKTHTLSWRPIRWQASAGPQTREHGVFLFDGAAQTAYLLQGSGYQPQWKPIEDSWRLDLTTGAWTPWIPSGDALPAAAGRRLAQVPNTKIGYLHGGYTGSEAEGNEVTIGDLYRVDVANEAHVLTKLGGGVPASARHLHALAYDAAGEQLIVYGGFNNLPTFSILDDTWLVKVAGETATWTEVKTKSKPDARYGAFYALDEESRRFIVWGGGRFPESETDPVNAAQDAWALDLAASPPAWTKLAPAGDAPAGRRNGCVMHDPVGRRLFIFGGTKDGRTTEKGLHVLSLEPGREAWSTVKAPNQPPMRSSGFGFHTPEGHVACGFGNDNDPYSDVNILGYFD